ncbi:hypothetical protein [Haladaptatus halobius]|uniref:hypothetical protein n=1 Tax=Haladaptatus halobius TaxID=2884875 RepID=UPI001D0A6427|nr:hypothetical protein [Haladaptatus halobius]
MTRSRGCLLTGRVDVETVRAAFGEHVLADAHERMLLPERVLVDLGVVAAFEEELLGDERLGVLPDLLCFVSNKSGFRPLRDVLFILKLKDISRGGDTLLTCQLDEFGRYVTADVPKVVAELLVPHLPESGLGWWLRLHPLRLPYRITVDKSVCDR